MQWLKDINRKWHIANNDIDYSDFKENLKPTSDLNIVVSDKKKSVIYIPTHNIHDVYEWFRIFKDNYTGSDEFDKYGFAIHGYFDKNRGQSIKGWFPNLIEVKASSTDVYKYYNDSFLGVIRSSVDYITTFTGIPELLIDGVKVFNEELVLLKNQQFENAGIFTLSSTVDKRYTIITNPGDDQYFKVGDRCFIMDANGSITDDEITNILFPSLYAMEITVKNSVIANAISIGDYDSGPWFLNDFRNQNGVYQYFENDLIPISEMHDKYKTYGQIVFTYQGVTNKNREFYLRRNTSGHYPTINNVWPVEYSEGDAYLIKCEIEYNLDTLKPVYPLTSPPYDKFEDVYRLLFLDSTMSDKVLAADEDGIGTYKTVDSSVIDTDINLGIQYPLYSPGLNLIIFDNIDLHGKLNVLNSYNNDKYYGSTVAPSYIFRHAVLGVGEYYNLTFKQPNNINFTQNAITTTVNVTYISGVFPQNYMFPYDFVNFKIDLKDGVTNKLWTAMNEQFVVVNCTLNTVGATIEFYPQLDINLLNELQTYITAETPGVGPAFPNEIFLNIDYVNTYGQHTADYTTNGNLNVELLLAAFNKTIIGKLYDFTHYIKTGTTDTYLKFNKIKQSHAYKWDNHGVIINAGPLYSQYAIDHTVEMNRRLYFKGYNNIQDFISLYLDCCPVNNIDLAQMQDVNVVYKNIVNAVDRLGVGGSNIQSIPSGNLIYFGPQYKEAILDNIKKDTVINITPASTTPSIAWVSKVEWDEDNKLGTITTLNYIVMPSSFENVVLSTVRDIQTISTWLYDIFNKNINERKNPDTLLPYTWSAHKPDTASYAFAMLNYAYDTTTTNKNSWLLNSLTGIVYKEFNEPRISFLKRDKYFKFSQDITNVDAASSLADGSINITSAPATIDGFTLSLGNLVLLQYQSTISENRIYVYNTAGNPLIEYGDVTPNSYWYVTGGTTNALQTYQSVFNAPLTPSTAITFSPVSLSTKMDKRLTMKPVEIAKLGNDNLTQPWKKINIKYDSIETSENLLNIEIGINQNRRIRFIDGLSENNIINNINGQGQYAWILDEDVIVDFAVVGCTKDTGPGTGTLIWYTGTWEAGVWVDGIWIQGTWVSGTWLNGTFNAFNILDNYYNVTYSTAQDNVVSIWKNGIWTNGTWNGGIAHDITWLNGTFNDGVINDGLWTSGTFIGGVMNHITWMDGTMNGGDFETGVWHKGLLQQLDPTNPARFGTKSNGTSSDFTKKAIWYEGIFDGGEFWSGINYNAGIYTPSTNHQGSIWYSGEFRSGDFWGGSFITGTFRNSTWHDGVWFGGYYVSSIANLIGNNKQLTILPNQYDNILGIANDIGYLPNTEHRMNRYFQTYFQMSAVVVAPNAFANDAFINLWDAAFALPYQELAYVPGSATATTMNLSISANSAATAVYQVANPALNNIDGRPFIYAVFKNSTWKKGVWLNGYFSDAIWEQGVWVNGWNNNSNFGLISI